MRVVLDDGTDVPVTRNLSRIYDVMRSGASIAMLYSLE